MLPAMDAYARDLRLRVPVAVDRGPPRAEVVKTFGVEAADRQALALKHRRETGEVALTALAPGRAQSSTRATAGQDAPSGLCSRCRLP